MTIAYHGGYVRGYQAEVAVCPEERIGIAYLSNSPNGVASRIVPGFLKFYIDYKKKIQDKTTADLSNPEQVSDQNISN
jgi:beta-lactamase class C